ncbi:MAG TPA: cobaltochelatase subunit CobN, partial [Acidisphaera sp.]|nr:cobaltochelatase subunit CobN [Acidisphaera sp.]
KAGYHDPDLSPCHEYIGFYLWLRHVADVHVIVHLGAHGTLEWLPGKAAALSAACFPSALLGGVPVIYPFIVNNPGEAAAAKRRLGAVTIGHLTPPLRDAGAHGAAQTLDQMIDAYAAADGLDRRRAALLRADILTLARDSGVLAESGVAPGDDDDAALARLDAYLCDVKDMRIRDGLHVFGAGTCGAEERTALLAALDARFVEPGPAGAPSRGRPDVLPTGRNLYSVDPRAVPTREAVALAGRAAAELLRRHVQDHGDWPRALVLDLWGSTTMRTGGEDLGLALVLMGARPVWDDNSARVSGVEILPLALLDRPRVDVTLRVSGLFRDAFEAQVALFDQAARAIAARDFEDGALNPLAEAARVGPSQGIRTAPARVFGPAPGAYGAGLLPLVERGAWRDRDALGAAYLAAASHAYGRDLAGKAAPESFASRVAEAHAFVHTQDHAETDVLDDGENAAHEGGFAAAAASLGAAPALYRLDTSRPDAPRARTLAEDLARVVRGRAANPAWIAGMKRHGRRGAAEISRTLDALYTFAAATPIRLDAQFELLFGATLGDADTDAFLCTANPDARAAMWARFEDARARGLWHTRRNDLGGTGDA